LIRQHQNSAKLLPSRPPPHLGDAISKEGRIASQGQANSTAPEDRTKLQQTSKVAQAILLRSDGRPRRELLQRSSTPTDPLDVTSKLPESKVEGSDEPHTHQVPPKGPSPHPRTSDLSSASAGQGFSKLPILI
jgi:hypothetical protein